MENTDYGGILLANMNFVSNKLPKALPWIEPSINCLHQESILSLIVGNNECAIMSMCSLMEHVLRLAIINKEECGLIRQESIAEIDKYGSLTVLIDRAAGTDVFDGCREDWWREVSKCIRNKSAHYLLPKILRMCAESTELKKYINEHELPENTEKDYYAKYVSDWGAFYHSSGRELAITFLCDATEQIRTIINNTNWKGDDSWWKSLHSAYDQFFNYDWTPDNIRLSLDNSIINY